MCILYSIKYQSVQRAEWLWYHYGKRAQALDAAPRAGHGLAEGKPPRKRRGKRVLLRIIDSLLGRVLEGVREVARRPCHMLVLVPQNGAGHGLADGEPPRRGKSVLLRIINPLLGRVLEGASEVARGPGHMLTLFRGMARCAGDPGMAAAAGARGGDATAGDAEAERPHVRCRVTPSLGALRGAPLGTPLGAQRVAATAARRVAATANARAAARRGGPQREARVAPRPLAVVRATGHDQALQLELMAGRGVAGARCGMGLEVLVAGQVEHGDLGGGRLQRGGLGP